jgi:hypothetical protein
MKGFPDQFEVIKCERAVIGAVSTGMSFTSAKEKTVLIFK